MYEIKVSEMTCGSCANSIKQVLRKVDPTAEVKVNLKAQMVQVQSNQDESVITKIIQDAGFPVLESKKIS
jgi:copper chaperone